MTTIRVSVLITVVECSSGVFVVVVFDRVYITETCCIATCYSGGGDRPFDP